MTSFHKLIFFLGLPKDQFAQFVEVMLTLHQLHVKAPPIITPLAPNGLCSVKHYLDWEGMFLNSRYLIGWYLNSGSDLHITMKLTG